MSLHGLTEYPRVAPDVLVDFMDRYRMSLRKAFFTFYGNNESAEDALAEYREDGLIDSDFATFMANYLSHFNGEKVA
jgi:hypothetical protein